MKNYWNTHLKKKDGASRKLMYRENCKSQKPVKVDVIKPRPRAFKNFSRMTVGEATTAFISAGCTIPHSDSFRSPPMASHQSQLVSLENHTSWWESLLLDDNVNIEEGANGGVTTTKSSIAQEGSEAPARDQRWSLDVAADEDWYGNGWTDPALYDMALDCLELFDGNDELMIQ